MRPSWIRIASALLALAVPHLAGCSKNPVQVLDGGRWQAPQTELTYAPLESDTAGFRVHLYWYGYDQDGEVVRFRFAIDADTIRPAENWRVTTAHDSVFSFRVAPGDLVGGHVFWIVAEDDQGRFDPTPAKRFLAIRTTAPVSMITSGPLNGEVVERPNVTFGWRGTDPDGGPEGVPATLDSFEYLLLRPGTSFDSKHRALPQLRWISEYVDLINRSSAASLPAPYDDWKWVGTSEDAREFSGLASGAHVFAIRAIDAAGARDTRLEAGQNIRAFTIGAPGSHSLPLTIASDLLASPVTILTDGYLQTALLEGDAVRFTWFATPSALGTPIAGYSAALDDTTTAAWSEPSLKNLFLTLPTDLGPGPHLLYIRAVDFQGTSTMAIVALDVVRPPFRDPTRPRSVLYVDDFAAPPGDWASAVRGSPNFPTDLDEDEWWTRVILGPLTREYGVSWEQWDAVWMGTMSVENRRPPTLQDLANYRVVIWSADFNNTAALRTGLWNSLFGSDWSALTAYLRGGGTLIVTGFTLASQTCGYTNLPYYNDTRGMCGSLSAGSLEWRLTYFPRDFMGVDGAYPSEAAWRQFGARDFVEARPTSQGTIMGFQSAPVDTGGTGTGAKWNAYVFPGLTAEATLAPGLPKIEGLKLETFLGCRSDESGYRRETPALPIAAPIFTYHGVNKGVLQDLGPSPREGLVVGIATQAHDDGMGDGSLVTLGNARGVVGRMVFLGFPIYYIEDEQAYQVMRAAYEYVNGSPTLAGGTP